MIRTSVSHVEGSIATSRICISLHCDLATGNSDSNTASGKFIKVSLQYRYGTQRAPVATVTWYQSSWQVLPAN
jgi:hypothetical protein